MGYRVWDNLLKQWCDEGQVFIEPSGQLFIDGVEAHNSEISFESGWTDSNDTSIYTGDVVELTNEDGKTVHAICKFGSVVRPTFKHWVEIIGFYFQLIACGRKTFPIVNNYQGKHDTKLFTIIGNIYEEPDLAFNSTRKI